MMNRPADNNAAAICECHFSYSPPKFASHPHLIVYPSRDLVRHISELAGCVVRIWPTEQFWDCGDPDWPITWSELPVVAKVTTQGNKGFATSFGLFCDATLSDSDLNEVFSFNPDDIKDGWDEELWQSIVELAETRSWLLVPDDTGTHFVLITPPRFEGWVEELKIRLSKAEEEWSQISGDNYGEVTFVGFMSRYS